MNESEHAENLRKMLARYGKARELIDEFREKPLGPYSDPLLHCLSLLRSEPIPGKFVVLKTSKSSVWLVGTLGTERGESVKCLHDIGPFADRAAAEWYVFKQRWKRWVGEEIQ